MKWLMVLLLTGCASECRPPMAKPLDEPIEVHCDKRLDWVLVCTEIKPRQVAKND